MCSNARVGETDTENFLRYGRTINHFKIDITAHNLQIAKLSAPLFLNDTNCKQPERGQCLSPQASYKTCKVQETNCQVRQTFAQGCEKALAPFLTFLQHCNYHHIQTKSKYHQDISWAIAELIREEMIILNHLYTQVTRHQHLSFCGSSLLEH